MKTHTTPWFKMVTFLILMMGSVSFPALVGALIGLTQPGTLLEQMYHMQVGMGIGMIIGFFLMAIYFGLYNHYQIETRIGDLRYPPGVQGNQYEI